MQIELQSLGKIADQLRKENDRSVAIIAASLLELQLEELLTKTFLDHKDVTNFFQGYGPLASLSAKASLALFLGLIPADIFGDLTNIRKVRNIFAHRFDEIDFSQTPVSQYVANLISVKWFLHVMPLADKPISKEQEEEIRSRPRRAFEIGVSIAVWHLDSYLESTEKVVSKKPAFPFPALKE